MHSMLQNKKSFIALKEGIFHQNLRNAVCTTVPLRKVVRNIAHVYSRKLPKHINHFLQIIFTKERYKLDVNNIFRQMAHYLYSKYCIDCQ